MSLSALYNKSVTSDVPNLEIKVFKRKLRIYCGISLILFVVLVVICIVLVLLWFGVINKKPIVILNRLIKVKCGMIEGTIDDQVGTFRGIPYAYPPLGRRRFVHAQEILDEKGCRSVYGDGSQPYRADNYKSSCLQYDKTSNYLTGSEDCLFLNIYTPSTNPEKKLPVIFVISGVFFALGSGNMSGLTVSPDVVRATQAIHVTSNYRLGPMNSIVNPENNKTNHGMSDQLQALMWIHKNIAAFGGDPSNVILYGVGSGSTIALALFNSNHAVNLFSKLWISNPVAMVKNNLAKVLKNQKNNLINENKLENIQSQLKIETIFHNWTWVKIESLIEDRWFNFPTPDIPNELDNDFLVIDNYFIPESNLLKQISMHRNIPLVIGNNANEIDIFPSPKTVKLWTAEYFKEFIRSKLKPFNKVLNKTDTEIFNNYYAKDSSMTTEEGYTRAVTDIRITCPLNSMLKRLMGFSSIQPIYRYILEDKHNRFDYFNMIHLGALAAYGWDNILYFHGYKKRTDYGRYGEKELAMSAVLNKAMRDFAWDDELKDMASSKDGYVRMNLIKDGKIYQDCFLKTNECQLWEKTLGDIERFGWSV